MYLRKANAEAEEGTAGGEERAVMVTSENEVGLKPPRGWATGHNFGLKRYTTRT